MKTKKKENKPKYLVRTRDNHIWELDPLNGFYRSYSCRNIKHADGAEVHATPSMNYEDLTKIYGFIPIKKSEIPNYEQKNKEYYEFINWQHRSDGHDGCKGGTYQEWIEYKELWKKIREKTSK